MNVSQWGVITGTAELELVCVSVSVCVCVCAACGRLRRVLSHVKCCV